MPELTPEQSAAFSARDAVNSARTAYKVAIVKAYPPGTTVLFSRGRHRVEGVVCGYDWKPGYVLALNPKSGKILKFYGAPAFGAPAFGDLPEVVKCGPRCQDCGMGGNPLPPSEEEPDGCCLCGPCLSARSDHAAMAKEYAKRIP